MSGTTQLTQMSQTAQRKEARTVVLSSYLGSTIEFYDFLLYATAAAVAFPTVFFAGADPWAGAVEAYATFAAGYLARPLGGVIFGHFGDRIGRKGMLIVSMTVMGLASTAIGLIPGASLIGPWGAVILVLLRVLQGIAVGGEWGGAALMALEHSDPKRRGFSASFVNAGAPTGAFLGTVMMGIVSALPREEFLVWGWRVPFLLSLALLVVGLFVRLRVSESPIFAAAIAAEEKQNTAVKRKVPLFEVLRRPKALVFVMLAGAAAFGLQVSLSTFAVTYAVSKGAPQQGVLYAFAGASIISIAFVLFGGRISDRFGRRPVMITGLVLFVAYLFPMFALLGTGNAWLVFLAFTLALVFHSTLYGPFAAFVSEQFGTTSRYTGAALGYQLATLIGGGFTPGIVGSLYKGSGLNVGAVVGFLAALSLVSAVFILLTRESKDNDLTAVR
ncbi:MFS transporter [Sinomonas sp. JGH33]|uniref:MFS transporter n=1 Tax=Sinomonas terricola TaxID=3110330 RepID=A0ABU5T7F8_9MICC|nr:MFS transporter [Sinomonas sp. JGH33]MEA5455608.1 MFS transporter [Sinomonas sp. JGH33]